MCRQKKAELLYFSLWLNCVVPLQELGISSLEETKIHVTKSNNVYLTLEFGTVLYFSSNKLTIVQLEFKASKCLKGEICSPATPQYSAIFVENEFSVGSFGLLRCKVL